MTMVAPESFTWWESLIVLIIIVLGGMGSIPGVVLGAVVMVTMPELLRDFSDYRMLLLGVILVLPALFRPKGLWPFHAMIKVMIISRVLARASVIAYSKPIATPLPRVSQKDCWYIPWSAATR